MKGRHCFVKLTRPWSLVVRSARLSSLAASSFEGTALAPVVKRRLYGTSSRPVSPSLVFTENQENDDLCVAPGPWCVGA